MKFIMGPFKIFGHYLDMMKDFVLTVAMINLIGGIETIKNNPTDFMSAVS